LLRARRCSTHLGKRGRKRIAYPELTDKPGLAETATAIRDGSLSAVEAVDAAIGRIEKLDGSINALAVPDFERACATAKAMDQAIAKGSSPDPKRPLYGVPMTVKESFDVEGLQSCWGHASCTDYIAPHDSELVRRLKAAGAVIVGKTNVPVDLSDWQSFNPVYGRTTNPHDETRSPWGVFRWQRRGGGLWNGRGRIWHRHWRVCPRARAFLRYLGA